MYEILICPLKKLYQLAEDGDMTDVAAIAASSYDIRKDKMRLFGRSLCMHFADTPDAQRADAFNARTAAELAAFIQSLPASLDTLFVCCDSGESRSAAMAAAILRYLGQDEWRIWHNPHYHPNPLVYSLLCISLGAPVSPSDLQSRIRTNQQAFSDAINRKDVRE